MEGQTIFFASYVVLWVVVLVQVALILSMARLVGQLMSRRFPGAGARLIDPGPDIGMMLENWEGVDLLQHPVTFHFPRERGIFLLYVSPHCTLCASLIPPAKRFFKEIAADAEGAWVMVLGTRESQRDYAHKNDLGHNFVLEEGQLPATWRLGGAPFGLWIDATGQVVAKGMVNNREQLESLRYAVETGHPSFQSYISAQAEAAEQLRESVAAQKI